jgi:hypothetical protein
MTFVRRKFAPPAKLVTAKAASGMMLPHHCRLREVPCRVPPSSSHTTGSFCRSSVPCLQAEKSAVFCCETGHTALLEGADVATE